MAREEGILAGFEAADGFKAPSLSSSKKEDDAVLLL